MSNPSSGVISAVGTPAAERTSVKDTVISVLISLVLAFVFRGFVVEAFQIPTGSMAPTLLGAHMRFRSPVTGAEWTVAPWEYSDPRSVDHPKPIQRGTRQGEALLVHDPMSGAEIRPLLMPTLSGDRIFVLKYLYSVFDPSRFDVVVFKNPQNPQENFIKRLIGLPGEQIALVDGDVFVRPVSQVSGEAGNPWGGSGWTIARKPERVQRAVWQPVYKSESAPQNTQRDDRRWFSPPWKASGEGWQGLDGKSYRYSSSGPTRLDWDVDRWPLVDRYPYNEAPLGGARSAGIGLLPGPWLPRYDLFGPQFYYPVADLRLTAGVLPEGDGLEAGFNLSALGHQFQARLGKGKASINMRPQPGPNEGDDAAWKTLGSADVSGLFRKGEITNIEFWHVDQSLQIWVDGKKVLSAEYEWSPAERIQNAMGMTVEEASGKNLITDGTKYRMAGVSLAFDGSAVTLHRVGLSRDLHYQATIKNQLIDTPPGLATHPSTVLTTSPDHYFCCGDNSPSSHDGRSWTMVDPWVAAEVDDTVGVVHRNLVIGKAFFVYFPAMDSSRRIPIPDVGRMRLIW